MENLSIYNKVSQVPNEAKKQITAGRLTGFTDINPMWRIKVMTETFGIVGFGWKYNVTKQWTEKAGDEVRAFCNIELFVKVGDKWSEPIFGTGGASQITSEKKGLYFSDECYKMALTDALSVAMKNLGVGASVYFERDRTKYDQPAQVTTQATTQATTQTSAVPEAAAANLTTSEFIANYVKPAVEQAQSYQELTKIFKSYSEQLRKDKNLLTLFSTRRKQIEG